MTKLWAVTRPKRKWWFKMKFSGEHIDFRRKNKQDEQRNDSASSTARSLYNVTVNVKGKAVPLQAWSGPEGSRKLRFPDFMTTAQDGGKVVSLTHRPPLPPGNAPGTHFC